MIERYCLALNINLTKISHYPYILMKSILPNSSAIQRVICNRNRMSIENTRDAQKDRLGNQQSLLAELLDLQHRNPKVAHEKAQPKQPFEKLPDPPLMRLVKDIANNPFVVEPEPGGELAQCARNWNYRNRSPNYNIPKPHATTKTDQELVNQLGAPKYADREGAAIILDSMGKAALPSLRKGLEFTDPEIVDRAKGL